MQPDFSSRLSRYLRAVRSIISYLWNKISTRKTSLLVVESRNLPKISAEDDLAFPIEFSIEAVPLSLQASGRSKALWKEQVKTAALAVIGGDKQITKAPISVTIYYFSDGRMTGDVDNIIKPIVDSLCSVIYEDDSQVDRIVVQKFESDRFFRIENPTSELAAVLETEPPIVYIRIDDEVSGAK